MRVFQHLPDVLWLPASVGYEGVYTGRIKVGITLVVGVNGFSVQNRAGIVLD